MSLHPSYSKSHHFQNWAKTFECYPERFYQPASLTELRDIIDEARKNRKEVKVVGSGHSPSDIHCTSSWMIDVTKLNRILSIDRDQREIEVECGMKLHELNMHLDKLGWAVLNFGSISEQTVAGVICTGTHGSSLTHGIFSSQVVELTLLLADGSVIKCNKELNQDIFQAASLSLGALGVIVSVKIKCSKSFDLKGTLRVVTLEDFLLLWQKGEVWEASEFVRAWWFPYVRRVVINYQERAPPSPKHRPQMNPGTWIREKLIGHYFNKVALAIGIYRKKLLPFFEKLIFQGKYGLEPGIKREKLEPSYQGFQMDCICSQWIDEFAIRIEKGSEAIIELDKFFRRDSSCIIPFPNEPIYAHPPIEIRVSKCDNSAFLSQSYGHNVVYIGVIIYRPFHLNMEYRDYFKAFEGLMNKFEGRPHWAKKHFLSKEELRQRYPKFDQWLEIRKRLDPDGVFMGDYLRRDIV